MVDQIQSMTRRHGGKLRLVLWSFALVLSLSLALPLTGYLVTGSGEARAQAQEQDSEAQARSEEAQRRTQQEEQRRDFWREARKGTTGYSAVTGPEAGVLIQSGGDIWRSAREGPLLRWSGWVLLIVIAAIALFHLIVGSAKLAHPRTGRTVTRWSVFERIMHWYTAILFIILAITGLALLFGRTLLIPVLGKEGFAAFAAFAKPTHDYLALFFVVGIVLLLLPWLGQNIPRSYDFTWMKKGGGYVGGEHPPAGFVNAGEKIWFWLLFFGSIALIASGVFLLFPNFGWERGTMQLAHIVHAISGVALIAFALGHIYLGTLGNEGSFEGMWTGEVDEAWAQQHHNLWYDDIKRQGTRPASAHAPHAGHTAST